MGTDVCEGGNGANNNKTRLADSQLEPKGGNEEEKEEEGVTRSWLLFLLSP